MDDTDLPTVRVICGPTAAGKTHVSLRCAEIADAAIVSADSKQVYCGFDVGTAKPTMRDRSVVPHFGIDVLAPTERASAAWWATRADTWLKRILATGAAPVIVGGTGLYLRALFGGLFEEPPMDPADRSTLQAELAQTATDELRRRVSQLDPSRAGLGRAQLVRALEIVLLTGHRLSDLHRDRRTSPRWRARYLLVDPDARLATRIDQRTRHMMSCGWVDEVKSLMDCVPDDAPAWNATGYRAVREVALGRLTEENAVERVIIETRQYAKRQRTWFRHQLGSDADVTIVDATDPALERRLAGWWRRSLSGVVR